MMWYSNQAPSDIKAGWITTNVYQRVQKEFKDKGLGVVFKALKNMDVFKK